MQRVTFYYVILANYRYTCEYTRLHTLISYALLTGYNLNAHACLWYECVCTYRVCFRGGTLYTFNGEMNERYMHALCILMHLNIYSELCGPHMYVCTICTYVCMYGIYACTYVHVRIHTYIHLYVIVCMLSKFYHCIPKRDPCVTLQYFTCPLLYTVKLLYEYVLFLSLAETCKASCQETSADGELEAPTRGGTGE